MTNSAAPGNGQAHRFKLPPFNAVPPRAKRDRRLTGADHSVLQCVAEHDRFSLHNGGQPCWASVRTIARETELSRKTVERCIAHLTEYGYLTNHRMSQNRRHLAVIYAEAGVVTHDDSKAPGVVIPVPSGVVTAMTTESLPLNHCLESNFAEAGSAHQNVKGGREADCAEAQAWNEVAEDLAGSMRIPPELRISDARFAKKRAQVIHAIDDLAKAGTYDVERAKLFGAKLNGSSR